MSFDVYVDGAGCPNACEHCALDSTIGSFDITHNVNPIVDRCFIAAGSPVAKKTGGYHDYSWGRLDGWTCVDALPFVRSAFACATDPIRRGEFLALEPANGWGSLDGVVRCLGQLAHLCKQHPTATIRTRG